MIKLAPLTFIEHPDQNYTRKDEIASNIVYQEENTVDRRPALRSFLAKNRLYLKNQSKHGGYPLTGQLR
jgi:hypothetical protein